VKDTTIFKTGLTGELPKWLEEEFTSGSTETDELPEEELPDWLRTSQNGWRSCKFSSRCRGIKCFETDEPEDADSATGSAWFESLVENKGTDESTKISESEDRLETPPEWVTNEIEEQAETLIPGPYEAVPDAAAVEELASFTDSDDTSLDEGEPSEAEQKTTEPDIGILR
jgi:hypothetical protein